MGGGSGLGGAISGLLGSNLDSGINAGALGLQNPFGAQDVKGGVNTAQGALGMQANFLNQLQNANGVGNTSLAAHYAADAAGGGGPNPAQAMLNQSTGANTANQAALMAGQRGTGGNAGLMSRQAAMQGANNQQQMNGQAATMNAQQQLAAQQLLANIGGQQTAQQQQGLQNYSGGAQGLLGIQSNGLNQQNSNQMAIGQMNQTNARQNAQTNQALGGGFLNGMGSMMGSMGGGGAGGASAMGGPMAGGAMDAGGASSMMGPAMMMAAEGGQVPTTINGMGARSQFGQACNMKSGGHVPGKAAVKGDSYANDTVPAMLSPGEVVIPRHIMQQADPAAAAQRFVAAVLAKQGKK